jgi:hypothetical protein
MRCSTWLPVLVLFVGLGIGRDASAGAKMDWSEYLEPAGSRAPVRATPTQRPAKAEKASRAKKQSAKSQSKKAKRPVRSKRRR